MVFKCSGSVWVLKQYLNNLKNSMYFLATEPLNHSPLVCYSIDFLAVVTCSTDEGKMSRIVVNV